MRMPLSLGGLEPLVAVAAPFVRTLLAGREAILSSAAAVVDFLA